MSKPELLPGNKPQDIGTNPDREGRAPVGRGHRNDAVAIHRGARSVDDVEDGRKCRVALRAWLAATTIVGRAGGRHDGWDNNTAVTRPVDELSTPVGLLAVPGPIGCVGNSLNHSLVTDEQLAGMQDIMSGELSGVINHGSGLLQPA